MFYFEKFKENVLSFTKQKEYEFQIKKQVDTEFQKKKDLEILNDRIPPPGLFWNPLYDPMTRNLYSNGDFDDGGSQRNNNNSNENNKELIEQQNLDYEKAVQLSKEIFEERMKKEREEKTEKCEENIEERKEKYDSEKRKIEEKEKLERKKIDLSIKLGVEPEETEEDFISILFRFPDGNKITRRFFRKKTIEVYIFSFYFIKKVNFSQNLFDFIELNDILEIPYPFDLIRTYPFLSLSLEKSHLITETFPDSFQETLQIKKLNF